MSEIAIVGIGCRLPGGVRDPEGLWQFLTTKGDGIVEMPADRWSLERFYDPDPETPGRIYTRRGGFLQDSFWEFDPEFFGISPREASIMDPQQRLLLEVTQEALDDAGLASRVGGRQVGVYIGGFTSDNQSLRTSPLARQVINSHTATSGSYTMLSNRLSFVFDLRGPSMTIDTACSSSLVALHEAVAALDRGEAEVALAGGVNAMLSPETFVTMCKGRFLAFDGRCKTFDASADGYARGEGAGILVLKPLGAALRDGDRVYAVIRGTGSNQDGRTSGITVPNPVAQADLIRRVAREAGIAPEQIGYVEAHGTGTAVGDPLEMAAIGEVIGTAPGRERDVVVGSIKNSIGHLEAAAGVAGVIKAALVVRNRQIVPQVWLQELNPAIEFEALRLRVPLEVEPFPAGYERAVAAVNGFGYGGTNGHALVEEPPAALVAPARSAPARVFPLSARNDAAARQLAGAYAEHLVAVRGSDDPQMAADALVDAVWTRRAHHPFRFAVPFADADDLLTQLVSIADGEGRAGARTVIDPGAESGPGTEAGPVFVFSGMGPQWWRMGRDLLAAGGPFAETAREVDEQFVKIAGWSILDELARDEAESRVTRTEIAQPANFLVQVGLVSELARYGVRPAAVVGHSVGEVSAAYVSGALDLHDALLVSHHRSRLQATVAGTGVMVAVGLPEADVAAWLDSDPRVCVAAVNSPSAVTLAGEREALDELRERLVGAGIFAREVRVEVPYHSHLMDPILAELVEVLAPIQPAVPTLPLYSTVTGQLVDDASSGSASWGARYWADNVRRPVRFADAVGTLLAAGHRAFVEVGPHPVLSGNIREVLVRGGEQGVSIPTLTRGEDDAASLRRALADLYVAGALDEQGAPGADPGPAPWRDLPRHPFQRIPLWAEGEVTRRDRLGDEGSRPLPGDRTASSAPEWQAGLTAARFPWLPDHVVSGMVLVPGAAYLDAALSAGRLVTGREAPSLADVSFVAPIVVGAHEAPVIRLSVDESTRRFVIRSRPATDEQWAVNATGRIVDGRMEPMLAPADPPALARARTVSGTELYARLDDIGLSYGPAFRRIVEARVGDGVVVATVDSSLVADSDHLAHPTITDAALQCVAALVGAGSGDGAVVPASVRAVRMFAPIPDRVEVTVTRLPGATLRADVALRASDGSCVLELIGVEFRPIAPRPSVASELAPIWISGRFEPREPRDPARVREPVGSDPAAEESLLLVALGEDRRAFAERLAARRDRAQVVVVTGDDPADLTEQLLATVRPLLAVDGPVLVAVCAVDEAERDTDADTVRSAVGDCAALVAAARAVQFVLDEAVLADPGTFRRHPVHGVVISRGGLTVEGDTGGADVAAAGLVGVRRVLRNEQPGLSWRLIDVDAGPAADFPSRDVTALMGLVDVELVTGGAYAEDDVDEVALRDGVRMVLRTPKTLTERLDAFEVTRPSVDPGQSYRIEQPASHLLADLALRETPRRDPGPGEVEIRIDALPLSYKDGLKVLGMLGEHELAGTFFGTGLGMEGMGVIERVGPAVGSRVPAHAVGDRVYVGSRDITQRYLTISLDSEDSLDPVPSTWTSLGDSGSGAVFTTARYCLVHLARVRVGETVLVHGAAGGVGMAAVQVAKYEGAVVIASASTPERREVARSMGADHVVDSRSLTFVEQVRALTGGRGVDVVISSAPGDVLQANLEVAAEFGRVIEVGKSEIYGRKALELGAFDKNLTFSSVDVDRMFLHRRGLLDQIVRENRALHEQGAYRPLPSVVLPVSQLPDAFDMVVRSTHVGRVVLDLTEEHPPVKAARPVAAIHPDATYLITGGFGAFGLATASWLAGRGARNLVLVGRRGARTAEQLARVAALEASGVRVVQEAVDVAVLDDVRALLDRVTGRVGGTLPPLRGVFHAAGVLRDSSFIEITAAGLQEVVQAKAVSAWNLHQVLAEAEIDLDHFVLYSSVTALSGTVPQIPYAAANAMIDALAHYRRARGLAAITVNWGPLAGGGMAESSDEVVRYLAMLGLRAIDMDRACEYLDLTMATGVVQASIMDLDWARWATLNPKSANLPRFAEHILAASGGGSASGIRGELAALPTEQRIEVVGFILAEQVAGVLGIPAESVDVQAPLPDLGLDSLMAVELSARVNVTLGLEISALEFSRGGGLAALAARLVDQLAEPASAVGVTTSAPAPTTPTVAVAL